MSSGTIEIDEEAINNLRSDYKQHLPQRPQKGRQPNSAARGHQLQKVRNNYQQRNFAKNNRPHNLQK